MAFEEWWENNSRDIILEAAINSDINKENDRERIVAVTAWEAAQPKWQPIETAPHKEEVLLKFPTNDICNGSSLDGVRWYHKFEVTEDQPTHWMPLPKKEENYDI